MSSTETELKRPDLEEVYGSLNWFDEQAIRTHLGTDVHELMELLAQEAASLGQVIELVRAFEFVAATREGSTAPAALDKVRKLTTKEVNDLATAYLDEEHEAMPDEPDTDSGKDDSGSE